MVEKIIPISLVILLAILNGYRYAVELSSNHLLALKKSNPEDEPVPLRTFLRNENNYSLSFLFLSVFLVVCYAATVMILIRDVLPDLLSSLHIHIQEDNFYLVALLNILLATVFLFLVGWSIPRALFRRNPFSKVQTFFPLINSLHYLVFPLANSLFQFSKQFVKTMFNEKANFHTDIFVKSELTQSSLKAALNKDYETKQELIHNTLDIQNLKVKHIFIPRNEVVYIDINDSIDHLKRLFIETQLSKIVVIDHDIDNVKGYVHHLDMASQPTSIASILHKADAVPEGMPLFSLFEKLRKDRRSLAWVIDEFGGTSGIVTMEDVLEELFGEIKDEHDQDFEYLEKVESPNQYLLSGRLELDYLEKKYDIPFPDHQNAETLSGFIIQQLNEIPKSGYTFKLDNLEITVLQVKDKKIESVRLKVED